jgi:hypothetical protein
VHLHDERTAHLLQDLPLRFRVVNLIPSQKVLLFQNFHCKELFSVFLLDQKHLAKRTPANNSQYFKVLLIDLFRVETSPELTWLLALVLNNV